MSDRKPPLLGRRRVEEAHEYRRRDQVSPRDLPRFSGGSGGLLDLLLASQATIGVAFLAFSILLARIVQDHPAAVMKQLCATDEHDHGTHISLIAKTDVSRLPPEAHGQILLGPACYDPSFMNTTAQREFWNGQPAARETLWALSKRHRPARLVLYTHQLRWELRIESGDLLMTQVFRSDLEIEEVSAGWKEAMINKVWSEHVNDTAID